MTPLTLNLFHCSSIAFQCTGQALFKFNYISDAEFFNDRLCDFPDSVRTSVFDCESHDKELVFYCLFITCHKLACSHEAHDVLLDKCTECKIKTCSPCTLRFCAACTICNMHLMHRAPIALLAKWGFSSHANGLYFIPCILKQSALHEYTFRMRLVLEFALHAFRASLYK